MLTLVACNTPSLATQKAESATATITPTKETATATPPSFDCQAAFERRELEEPYQRQTANQPRYTLSTDELNYYLGLMGIPVELGAPKGYSAARRSPMKLARFLLKTIGLLRTVSAG